MTGIKLALMLYFFMGADKATCQTLLKAFLKLKKSVVNIVGQRKSPMTSLFY